MKSENQTIDVDGEERFDNLIKLHKEIKNFKKNESAGILSKFHVKNFKVHRGTDESTYCKFQLNVMVEGEEPELQLNLSSTTVCTYVLSQYSDIWSDKKSNEKFEDMNKYCEFIFYALKKCVSDDDKDVPDKTKIADSEVELEPIDEFSLLNVLSLLKKIIPKSESGTAIIDEINLNIINKIIRTLCKQFIIKEIPIFREGGEKHPFVFYKFLCMILDWNKEIREDVGADRDAWLTCDTEKENSKLNEFVKWVETRGSVFEYFFDNIYNDAKYEIYRQLSLYHASDSSLFDVKRLIYGLLIVKLEDRYSNELIVKNVLDLIFETQYKTTGLWPICHGVNSDFYMEGDKIREEYKEGVIISGSPILSSIECLSDMLGHKDIELDDEYYKKLEVTYDWISNRIIKEGKTKMGWYPEYGRDRTPKSWTTGHTLIFLKRYCEKISKLIEREASKSVSAEDSADFIDWDELADSYGFKKIIEEYIIDPIEANEELKYRSMLLFGPPGSGKSTVGRALAKRLKWEYVELTPGLFLDEGNDKIISKLNRIFKRLVRLKKKVIFFDEVDQLVESRKKGGEGSKWIVTSILPKLSELRKQKDIIFILATNHPGNVDEAIVRLGRIDFKLPVGAISWKSRLEMLKKKKKWAEEKGAVESDAYKGIEKLLGDDLIESEMPPQLRNYLERTNFIPFVQIDRMLEEMFTEDYSEFYKILFRDNNNNFVDYEDPEFKKFVTYEPLMDIEDHEFEQFVTDEKAEIRRYSRLPNDKHLKLLEEHIENNRF